MKFPILLARAGVAALVIVMVMLTGCSTTAGLTYLKRADQPLNLTGLRIVYVQREIKLNSTATVFKDAHLNESAAELGKAVLEQLPSGLAPLGIETATYLMPTNSEGQFTAEAQNWLRTHHTNWPVLFVAPVGGHVFCTPCYFKTDAVMEIKSAPPVTTQWAIRLQQPALTPNFEPGTLAMHRHFADEMLRALLIDVRGPKSP
jgi:hypothetical protein